VKTSKIIGWDFRNNSLAHKNAVKNCDKLLLFYRLPEIWQAVV